MSSTSDPNSASKLDDEDLTVDLTPYIKRDEGHCVGGGGFGDVYRGIRSDEPHLSEEKRMVAIKVIRPLQVHYDVKSKVLKRLTREIAVWQALEHDNIVPLLGVSYSFGTLPALISVWMDNGQLNVYLSTHPNADRSRIAEGLANGLLYLHTRVPQITHGDIKAANTLVDREGNPRLCDFGLSRIISEDDLWMTTTVNSRGSVRWMAPELLEGSQVLPTPESDVYAFAMTILEMLTGRIPFHHHRSDHAVTMAILFRKEVPNRPTGVDGADLWQMDLDALWECLTRCWDPEPGRRPTMALVEEFFRLGRENRANGADGMPPINLLKQFKGHTDVVWSVAFSPDSKRIASGSWDQTMRVWDAETGALAFGPVGGDTGLVYSVAYSPDGKKIALGFSDRAVRVWLLDVEPEGMLYSLFEGYLGEVYSVAFSPNGKQIASGSIDKTVRIWDVETGKALLTPFEGHTGYVASVAFSPDGKRIASGSWDSTVRVWNAETGEMLVGPFEGYTGEINSVAFSSDGKRIASAGSGDYHVWVWDADTGNALLKPFVGHTGHIACVAFSPDGKWIASGSYDMTMRVWDAVTGDVLPGPCQGHEGAVTSVAFSPDGKWIASGSVDKTVCVWSAGRRV